MGHVISAVEVIIDVDLPVAMYVVAPPVEVVQLADSEGRNALGEAAEELLQRRGLRVEVHEHKALPGFDLDGNQTVLRAIKVLHAIGLRHALERAVEAVFPSVVRTLQNLRMTAGLSHNGGSVVTADIIEGAQRTVGSANDDDRFSGQPRGYKVTRLLQLVGAGDQLPGLAEDVEPLEFGDARIDIPRRRNG